MSQPALYFYLPLPLWPETLPDRANINWSGFGLGIYAWTIQTYLRLQEAGVACELVNYLPQTGIVFLHRNAFRYHPQGVEGYSRRLLVCFQGDLPPHPDAQAHIVQNPVQEREKAGAYFMPHWPQPGLQRRDTNRGDRFETVAFFGHTANLAPELTGSDWLAVLQNLGLQWQPVVNTNRWNEHSTLDTRWNNYRQVDVVVAARSFDPKLLAQTDEYRYKPATKLYNAWLAGVPAILGQESGYRAERQSNLDYIEVTTFAEVVQALRRLKEDKALRQAMLLQGEWRSQAITPEQLTQRWLHLIQYTLFPAYEHWCCQSQWQRQLFRYQSRFRYGSQRLQQRWRDWQYSLN
ncbi:MAG: hypothetical protein F6K42_19525 [Leptolyngbya sp. SIO1D8]|nr:hypothetical protein [Leptolyngbya sp. SIO1D8]